MTGAATACAQVPVFSSGVGTKLIEIGILRSTALPSFRHGLRLAKTHPIWVTR